jgi:hypothetical protein
MQKERKRNPRSLWWFDDAFARGKLMIDQLISNVASCSIELLKLCFFGSGKHTKTTRSRGARECFRRLLWLTFHVKVREKKSRCSPFSLGCGSKGHKEGSREFS